MKKNICKSQTHIVLMLICTAVTASCKTSSDQLACLRMRIDSVKGTPTYKLVEKAAKDSIWSWNKSGAYLAQNYSIDKWRIGPIIFDSEMAHCILIVPKVDSDSLAKLDDIEIMAGELKNGAWHFYTSSMPAISVNRRRFTNSKPATFEQLEEMGVKELIRGGLFMKGTCEIDQQYILGWFKPDIYEQHERFLKQRDQ